MTNETIVTWLATRLRKSKDHRMNAPQVISELYTTFGKIEVQKVFTGLDGLKKFIIKESTHFVWEDLGLMAAISLAPELAPSSRSASAVSNLIVAWLASQLREKKGGRLLPLLIREQSLRKLLR